MARILVGLAPRFRKLSYGSISNLPIDDSLFAPDISHPLSGFDPPTCMDQYASISSMSDKDQNVQKAVSDG